MRSILAFGIIVLVSVVAIGAEKPIPQDAARIEKQRREQREWHRRTLGGAYDKAGKKDPRWDKPARQAMDVAAGVLSEQIDPELTYDDIYKPAKAAVDAGCDDPMLVDLYNNSLVGPRRPGAKEVIRRTQDAAKALAASRYPAFRRAIALQLAGTYGLSVDEPDEATRKEAERNFDAALALLSESAATDEQNVFWEQRWFDILNSLIAGYRKLGVDAPAAYERVDAPFGKLPALKVLRLKVRGHFWYIYGWEARGNSFAASVPEGGFASLEQRLEKAKKAFEEAGRIRPEDSRTAVDLMDIDKTVGGDRTTMELWFDRAMKADGDCYAACSTKLDWLDPKWHGTADEMLAFGHACGATKNWRVGIPLLAVNAHYRHVITLAPAEQAKYLSSPAVWSEITSIFDEYLKHHPSNNVQRSKYAALAFMAHKYPEAQALFQTIGDHLTSWPDSPFVPYEQMKRIRGITVQIAGKWTLFGGRNNEGEWTINVPVKPERRQEAGMLGAKARNVWTCAAAGVTYRLRVQPVPPAVRNRGEESALNAVRNAIVMEHDGRARNEHSTTLAGHAARDFVVDAPKLNPAVLRVRAVIIGNKLYELSVSGPEADVMAIVAGSFLDTFKFEAQQ